VILPDINLLVYAYNSSSPRHAKAREWWQARLSRRGQVGLAWVVALGYLRLMTSRAVLVDPLTPSEALGHVRSWMERPQVQIVQPGPRHLDLLEALTTEAGAAGTLTTDAHLAALAIEHQAELHSNDADFSRFSGLRWLDPLK
jgi:toxin-antitoxin system PIN domain toxin